MRKTIKSENLNQSFETFICIDFLKGVEQEALVSFHSGHTEFRHQKQFKQLM
jgi:hypothetical protein